MDTNPLTSSSSSKVFINALSASLQILVSGAVYFFLYNYLITKIGPEQLGVWSLVLATSSIANVASFGISSGLVKFIAEYNVSGRKQEIQILVTTSFVTLLVFFLLLIVILYELGQFILSYAVDANYIQTAKQLLPYSLVCLWINALGGVFTSILEGFQKNYLRNIIVALSGFVFLGCTYLLFPQFNLLGVAYAQLAQSLFIFILSFIISIKQIEIKRSNWVWNRSIFREIMSYGYKFQIVSVCQMLYDPITKVLLARFGDLGSVGYYEMASRLVSQVRSLVVNANQVMIPLVTEAAYSGRKALIRIYLNSFTITVLVASPIFAAIIFFSPIVSIVWIGHFEPVFISFVFILSISMLINIFSVPAYFGYLGEGKLTPLIWSHIGMGVINGVAGYFFGILWLSYGVIVAWGISISLGSIALIDAYHKEHGFNISAVFNKANIGVLFCSIFFIACYIFYIFADFCFNCYNTMLIAGIQAIIFTGVFFPIFYGNDFLRGLLRKFQFK